ncbi:MAG: YaaL family protein [Pseudoflavonifractor sp.]
MAETAKVFAFRKKRMTPAEEERDALMVGLCKTRTLIAQAYSSFNTADDPDLVESYVFEINALQARYSYLLRRVKELEVRSPAPAVAGAR